jgi:hypothetical protein
MFFTIFGVPEEKGSSAGTANHTSCRISHEGRLTLKHIFEKFFIHEIIVVV